MECNLNAVCVKAHRLYQRNIPEKKLNCRQSWRDDLLFQCRYFLQVQVKQQTQITQGIGGGGFGTI
jgi:hypothetical protein